MFTALRPIVPAILALAIACTVGCVKGETSSAVRYEKVRDEFRFLFIVSNLRGQKPRDLDWIAALYERRRNIIPTRFKEILYLWGEPAYLRVTDSTFVPLDLTSPAKAPPAQSTTIPLNSFQITPGEFFIGADESLCCDHEMAIPGKTIDLLLLEAGRSTCDAIQKMISEEISRRDGGGPRRSWDDVRPMQKDEGGAAPATLTFPLPEYLEKESLEMLLAAAKKQAIAVQRREGKFSISLPLREADARELKTRAEEMFAYFGRDLDPTDGLRQLLESLKAEVDKDTLTFACSLPSYLAFAKFDEIGKQKLDADTKPDSEKTIASMKERGFTFNSETTIPKRVERFKSAP